MTGRKGLIVPVLIIAVGVTWLLNVMGVMPGIDWIWTGCLAVSGILVLALGGINRLSLVVGPFLIIASVCSVLRQTGKLPLDYEVPILTIVLGCLMALVRILPVPASESQEDKADGK